MGKFYSFSAYCIVFITEHTVAIKDSYIRAGVLLNFWKLGRPVHWLCFVVVINNLVCSVLHDNCIIY